MADPSPAQPGNDAAHSHLHYATVQDLILRYDNRRNAFESQNVSFAKRIDNKFEMYFRHAADGQVIVQWGGIEGGIFRDNVVYLHQGESLGNLSFGEMAAAQGGVILWDPALKKGRFLVTNSPIPKRSLLSIFGGRLPFIFILAAVTTAFVLVFSK